MNRDEALLKLHDALRAKSEGGYTSMTPDERREYHRQKDRESYARKRAAVESGDLEPKKGIVRDVLADAALMILATDAPGAEQIRKVLAAAFSQRPGVPMTVENDARRGKLKPKIVRL
jgi:hypothetical protein